MTIRTIAIQSPGDMGSGVGRDLVARGFRAVTCLAGRSERSRKLAGAAGLEIAESLDALVETADLLLSILPPAAAESFAGEAAAAMRRTGARPAVAECNAISPATAGRIAARFAGTGAASSTPGSSVRPPAGPTFPPASTAAARIPRPSKRSTAPP